VGCHFLLLFDHFQFALIHGPNIPGLYAILLFTALDFTSNTSHIHNWMLLFLWLHLFVLFGVFFHSSPVAYWVPTDLGSSSFIVIPFLPFPTVHGVLKERIFKWFAIPFSSGRHCVRSLHHNLSIWVALQGMAHSFTELDKTVVNVFILISFLWLWFSVCLLSDGAG